MALFRYDGYSDEVVFDLADGFEAVEEVNDEGELTKSIRTGKDHDDEGNTTYDFSLSLSVGEYEDGQTFDELEEDVKSENDNAVFVRIPGKPAVVLYSFLYTKTIVFGIELKFLTTIGFAEIDSEKYLSVITIKVISDDESENIEEHFSNTVEVISSLSVNGKRVEISEDEKTRIKNTLSGCLDVGYAPALEFKKGQTYEESLKNNLPEQIHTTDGGYVTVNNDWAVKLPAGWLYSSDGECNGNRPFAALDSDEYFGGQLNYGNNCFVVFRLDDAPEMINAARVYAFMAGREEKEIINREGLRVTVSYNEILDTTRAQNVVITTAVGAYNTQYFYTDPDKDADERHRAMEEIIKTICLVKDIPQS